MAVVQNSIGKDLTRIILSEGKSLTQTFLLYAKIGQLIMKTDLSFASNQHLPKKRFKKTGESLTGWSKFLFNVLHGIPNVQKISKSSLKETESHESSPGHYFLTIQSVKADCDRCIPARTVKSIFVDEPERPLL